jgi:hypothetical protein
MKDVDIAPTTAKRRLFYTHASPDPSQGHSGILKTHLEYHDIERRIQEKMGNTVGLMDHTPWQSQSRRISPWLCVP